MNDDTRSGAWPLTDIGQLSRFWPGGRFWTVGGQPFEGRVFRRVLPTMQLEGIEGAPYGSVRPADLITEYPADLLVISAVVEGHGRAECDGVAIDLVAGDVLIHRKRSLSSEFPVQTRTFRVVLEAGLVADGAAPVFFPFERVPRSVLSGAFIRFAHEVLRSVARPPALLTRETPQLEQALLVLLRGIVGEVLEREHLAFDSAVVLRVRAERWIEEHLEDPELSAGSIATALAISRRRLFQLFEGESESLMTTIRRRRVEAASEQLRTDPVATIGTIASRVGFRSTDTFVRAYHRHYGHAPRQTRRPRGRGPASTAPPTVAG